MVINPLIFKNQNFDPKTSLSHVTRLFYLQYVFAVNASLNVKTFDQLAALAQSKPQTMNYLTPSLSKVAFMETFNKKYGIDFVRVPFKGGRRCRQQHDGRHDAGRHLWHQQSDPAHSRWKNRRLGGPGGSPRHDRESAPAGAETDWPIHGAVA
jgi:hypothetical protein